MQHYVQGPTILYYITLHKYVFGNLDATRESGKGSYSNYFAKSIHILPQTKSFNQIIPHSKLACSVTKSWAIKEFRPKQLPLQLDILLFNRSKSLGSGCTTALSVMHCYLCHVQRLTSPTSLCSDNTQNVHRSSA